MSFRHHFYSILNSLLLMYLQHYIYYNIKLIILYGKFYFLQFPTIFNHFKYFIVLNYLYFYLLYTLKFFLLWFLLIVDHVSSIFLMELNLRKPMSWQQYNLYHFMFLLLYANMFTTIFWVLFHYQLNNVLQYYHYYLLYINHDTILEMVLFLILLKT